MLESLIVYIPLALLFLVVSIFKIGINITTKDIDYLNVSPYNIATGIEVKKDMFALNRILKIIYGLLGLVMIVLIWYIKE